eukprot:Sspe_Gene.75092::Locus_46930_Transcript_2_2_Confidence_0.667_Length_937::g.75092::m.75092
MGGPLVHSTFKFGRTDQAVKVRAQRLQQKLPRDDATPEEIRVWGKQYGLGVPATVALLGGLPNGSVLLGTGGSPMTELDNSTMYNALLEAKGNVDAQRKLRWGAIMTDPEMVKCVEAFVHEPLRWNKYFA